MVGAGSRILCCALGYGTIDAVFAAVENTRFNQKELDNRLKKFEEDWVASRTMTKRLTKGDFARVCPSLVKKI